ncbi:MAG: fibronectin type III domain-containing protein [bacterium]
MSTISYAHVNGKPSVHDVVTDIRKRLMNDLSTDEILALKSGDIKTVLSQEEIQLLGEGHIYLHVNVPVELYVFYNEEHPEPFWLEPRGFEEQDYVITVDDERYLSKKRNFEAGLIGLGVNSLQEEEDHYFVVVAPQEDSTGVEISQLYPGQAGVTRVEVGAQPYVDDDDQIQSCPEELLQDTLIQVSEDWEAFGVILGNMHATRFPSTAQPDQIVLTWSGDPKTSQTIQWRTSTDVNTGKVAYQKKSDFNHFSPKQPTVVTAKTELLETLNIINDPVCHRHTVTLENLEPDTTYVYSVGDGSEDGWSELAEFTTAPERIVPFSFIYMGDVQNGLDRWGTLIHNAFRERPDAMFYIMAGDLVNRGNERWDWDDFFYNARGIFNTRTVVPVIGNHENQGGFPKLYLDLFHLATNGPVEIEPERAYSFEYSNALFVVLDSNLSPERQAHWLEKQLANSGKTWKFVIHHHPAYSSAPNRNNKGIQDLWVPLYDRYHVDMVLQGHDHAYLRTYPMKAHEVVQSTDEGTIYVVSVSGTKMYEQADHYYTDVGMTNTSTYQVLDIQIAGDRLLYRAYDIDGNLKDEITIEK